MEKAGLCGNASSLELARVERSSRDLHKDFSRAALIS